MWFIFNSRVSLYIKEWPIWDTSK